MMVWGIGDPVGMHGRRMIVADVSVMVFNHGIFGCTFWMEVVVLVVLTDKRDFCDFFYFN